MKRKFFLAVMIAAALVSCRPASMKKKGEQKQKKEPFKRETVKLESDRMTPEALWNLGRVSGGSVSPDKSKVIYGVSYYSVKQNRSNRDLYIMNADGSDLKQITKTDGGEYSETWRPDGKKIAFLAVGKNGGMQLWEMNPDGSHKQQVTDIKSGISGFIYSPTLKKILYTKDVKVKQTPQDIYPDLPKANVRIYDDIMYRHWDNWEDENYSHIFVADLEIGNKSTVENAVDIMEDQPFDSPMKPWGGSEEIAWSPDGVEIAYTCKKKQGKEYATSTNSDIYIYNTQTQKTGNLTKGLMGYDKCPTFSPDGKKIAWTSMRRDGFEADQNRIYIYDSEKKTRSNYSKNFDQSASHLVWSPESDVLYFVSGIKATYQLYKLDLKENKIDQITKGTHNYRSFELAGDKMIASKQSMSYPTEVFSVDIASGEEIQISFVNKELLGKMTFGKVEERWIKTTDNKKMLTWVIYPPHFDPKKKYPALLYCQGGPQSAVSQFWSYRWNFQMMAANDYIIVAPNRRGLPTFGQEWNDQISKDYGGQNMKDYFAAIDELKKENYIDENRLGAVGASYGGFSVYWLAGNHNKRFKAFISHCGIFNFEAMYASTEEVFFCHWDMGGSFWNKEKKNSYGASPHLFVKNWDTPILVIHGEKDFRIPYTQGMQAFNCARLKNIPSRFVSFPQENHWVLSPQNGILWQREFYSWLDKYLKPSKKEVQ